jgi:hypothetical protein
MADANYISTYLAPGGFLPGAFRLPPTRKMEDEMSLNCGKRENMIFIFFRLFSIRFEISVIL